MAKKDTAIGKGPNLNSPGLLRLPYIKVVYLYKKKIATLRSSAVTIVIGEIRFSTETK